VEPQVLASVAILAGTMVAGLRMTRLRLWEAHKQCPRCGAALPDAAHARDCELRDRL
jgi:hypothetical protein